MSDTRTDPPSAAGSRAPEHPVRTTALLVALCGASLVALLVALVVGGGAPGRVPPGIPDAGPVVGWTQVGLTWVVTAALVASVGAALYAVLLAPRRDGRLAGTGARAMRWAAMISAVGFVAGLANVLFTFCYVYAFPLSATDLAAVRVFALDTDLGRAGLVSALIFLVVAAGARTSRTLTGAAWTFGIALVGVVPPALVGHAASQVNHDLAMMSLLVHIVAVTLWVGGLLALVVFPRRASDVALAAAARYSALALVCFVATAMSGVANAALRLTSFDQLLTTGYGVLVVGKTLALLALGVFGRQHRRYTLRRMAEGSRRAFAQLASGELVVMAMAIGLGVALSRTPTPQSPLRSWTRAENLVGHELPVLSGSRWLTAWRPDVSAMLAIGLVGFLYLAGVVRLHRAGVRWPVGRTLTWLTALVVLGYALLGAPTYYGTALFSAHMVLHMLLSMLVPILLALGAPITLALRAIRPRPTGSIDRGPREWLLVLLHSRAARVITHPLVVLALYLGTLYAFYFSPLFSATLQSHTAHMLMHAHFLLIGCLFYWPIVGIDPMPRRLPYLGRIGLLFASLPFHAFFAVVVMGDDSILGGDWFRRLSISWVDLHADQQTGGGFAWAFSEIPTLILIVAIVVQWYRADRREARRFDRHEDRTGDAQLTAYNDWLSSLSGRESSSREPSDR